MLLVVGRQPDNKEETLNASKFSDIKYSFWLNKQMIRAEHLRELEKRFHNHFGTCAYHRRCSARRAVISRALDSGPSCVACCRASKEYQNHILCLHSTCKSNTVREKWEMMELIRRFFHNSCRVFGDFPRLFVFFPIFPHTRIRGGIWEHTKNIQKKEQKVREISICLWIFTSVLVSGETLRTFLSFWAGFGAPFKSV